MKNYQSAFLCVLILILSLILSSNSFSQKMVNSEIPMVQDSVMDNGGKKKNESIDSGVSKDSSIKSNSNFKIKDPNNTKAYNGPLAGFLSFQGNFAKGAIFGVFHEKILPSSNERFSFYGEVSYYFLSHDFKEERYIDENDFQISSGHVKSGYLRLGSNIRFVLIKGGKLEPFIGVGASLDLNTSYNRSTETYYRYFTIQRTTSDVESDTRGLSLRSNVELGLNFKSVILDVRYDVPEESTYIVLAYRFAKKNKSE